MTYLILGANGLIGQHVVRCCKDKNLCYTGTSFSRETAGLIPFNLLDFDSIGRVFDQVKPTVVINSIGLAGGVNFCQENPAIGRNYHVEATRLMVDWCRRSGAVFAFISTDYVFDGTHPPYKETDPTCPLNLYGQYKREAEQYIQANLDRYIIARTTNVFGWDPGTKTPNFLMHLIATLKTQDTIQVPSFLYGTPTYAGDLAAGVMDLIGQQFYGLFHIVGPDYINRYDWAVKCLNMAGMTGKTVLKQEYPPVNMVPRPLLSHLDNSKFRSLSAVHMHGIKSGLELFIQHMRQQPL